MQVSQFTSWTEQERQFRKMCSVIENLEALVIDAHKNKGPTWVQQEPLWVTWSLEKFGQCTR